MGDPLTFIGDADLAIVFAMAAGLALLVGTGFPALRTPETPGGIITLELAARSATVRRIVDAWRHEGKLGAAWRSLWLDFVFIVLYTIALGSLAVLTGRATGVSGLIPVAHGETVAAAGALLAIAIAVLDLLEDVGLALALRGRHRQPIPLLTTLASTLKWLLLACLAVGTLDLLIASAIGGPN
jgi:hypothetical protein